MEVSCSAAAYPFLPSNLYQTYKLVYITLRAFSRSLWTKAVKYQPPRIRCVSPKTIGIDNAENRDEQEERGIFFCSSALLGGGFLVRSHFGRELDRLEETCRIRTALACDIVRGPVVYGGADDWKADGDIYGIAERQHL